MGKIRNDIILIICVGALIIAGFVFWIISSVNAPDDLYVNIYHQEELLYSYSINENRTVTVTGEISDVVIVIDDSEVYVKSSGCENQICVNEGKKSKANEQIICMPNLIYVYIGGHVDA